MPQRQHLRLRDNGKLWLRLEHTRSGHAVRAAHPLRPVQATGQGTCLLDSNVNCLQMHCSKACSAQHRANQPCLKFPCTELRQPALHLRHT